MLSNFNRSAVLVQASEGGNVDNPKDPGGRTGRGGITQREFDFYMELTQHPKRDVWTITSAEILAIYKAQYWDHVNGDLLPFGLDYALFDAGIMSGPVRAVEWLQQTLAITIDGHFGLETLSAVRAIGDVKGVIKNFEKWRMAWLQQHADWKDFGAGWTTRANRVTVDALVMAPLAPVADTRPTIDGIPIPAPSRQTAPIGQKVTKTMFGNISSWFSGEVMSSLERKGLAIIGTWLTQQGIVNADQAQSLIGGALVLLSLLTGVVQAKIAATNSKTVSAVGLIPAVSADKQPSQPSPLPATIPAK